MTDISQTPEVRAQVVADQRTIEPRRPPIATGGAIGWMKSNLFNSFFNTALTLLILYGLISIMPGLFSWAVTDAVWGDAGPAVCREEGAGACWSFVHTWWRFILFGLYPFDEQWRPALFIMLTIAMIGLSCYPGAWRKWLAGAWAVALFVMWTLMAGGMFGLSPVPTNQWGGLSLTIMLAGVACVGALPLGILLALGRRSDMPGIKAFCICFIEMIRGVPLITILFMASFMIPLFLPSGVTLDAVMRAMVGMTIFTGVYIAEAVRGGLQAIPKGQYEAADSLGLSYWQKTGFIILPQALKIAIPPVVNSFIAVFKDTSLVLIIGLFDMMTATKNAIQDAEWRPFYMEGYVFASLIYFSFCFYMSRYSLWLEKRLSRSHAR